MPSSFLMLFESLRYFSITLRLDEIATLLVVNNNPLLLEQIKSIEISNLTSFKS